MSPVFKLGTLGDPAHAHQSHKAHCIAAAALPPSHLAGTSMVLGCVSKLPPPPSCSTSAYLSVTKLCHLSQRPPQRDCQRQHTRTLLRANSRRGAGEATLSVRVVTLINLLVLAAIDWQRLDSNCLHVICSGCARQLTPQLCCRLISSCGGALC
jgi:hypothetical protein